VRPDRSTISLHEFWDDLVLGSSRFQTVRNTATALRLRPVHARDQFAELAHSQFAQWEQESVALAQEHAYRNGTLPGSPNNENGAVLPADYAQTVKPIGERRMILAGYRLADVLRQLFE
jgi:S1/P1 Nuclease